MPPRKKPRLSTSRDSSIPGTSPAATPISSSALFPAASSNPEPTTTSLSTNYWPLAAQTALFKALIASKPTGPHKHFHLLTIAHAIASDLGYYIPVTQIHEKISELYDIEQLDRREQEYAFRVRDKRGDWMPEVYESVFVLPGEPRVHGSRDVDGSEEGDGVDREAIKELFGARDADEAFFVDAVWRRRFVDVTEDDDVVDDAGEEASPAPSIAAGGGRRGRQTRGTRLSEIKAEDERDEDGENEEEEQEGGTPEAQKSTRTSGRRRRSKKR